MTEQENEQVVEQLPQNAAQQALMFLKENNLKVHEMIENMSSLRQMKRVMHAWIDHPVFNENPRFSYPQERELYNLGTQMQGNKLILLYCSFREQEMAEEIKARGLKQTEESKGEENGKTDQAN